MAIIPLHLRMLKELRSKLYQEKPIKVLSLGYPDILVPYRQVGGIFGQKIASDLSFRKDSKKIVRWHGLDPTKLDRIVETDSLFSALGFETDYIDIHPSRGIEKIVDLNKRLPAKFKGKYDLVLDLGTIEHCFNIAGAMVNLAMAVKKGGCILHTNPANMYEHGFYNINPTFYRDFYKENGFQIYDIRGVQGNAQSYRNFTLEKLDRKKGAPPRSLYIVLARKMVEKEKLTFPMQGKYQQNPNLKR
ncbi:MAG: hypothetical protein ACTSXQ_05065 [Alphaproteobacteria bacterium]